MRARLRIVLLLWGALTLNFTAKIAQAISPVSSFSRTISLKQMLYKGLKARRPEEFEYLDKVVALVDSGELPVSLVQGTFFWSRQRFVYPLQYFQEALYVRAKAMGRFAPGMNSDLSTAFTTMPGQGNSGDTGNHDN